jgi:hypothetical protein
MIEILDQNMFFGSILAGFSVTIVAQLITWTGKSRTQAGRTASWAILLFVVAALLFLAAVFLGSLYFREPSVLEGANRLRWFLKPDVWAYWINTAGFHVFLLGIGYLGFLRSLKLGILTMGIVIVFYVLEALIALQWVMALVLQPEL